jgi:hypothetical protein
MLTPVDVAALDAMVFSPPVDPLRRREPVAGHRYDWLRMWGGAHLERAVSFGKLHKEDAGKRGTTFTMVNAALERFIAQTGLDSRTDHEHGVCPTD